MSDKTFPNGFASYIETYHEVAAHATRNLINDNYRGIFFDRNEHQGYIGVYELAEELTDEFEKLHEGRVWYGEFWDVIDAFLAAQETAFLEGYGLLTIPRTTNMIQEDNDQRADRALDALFEHTELSRDSLEFLPVYIADMLTILMHLCQRECIDFNLCLQNAQMSHYIQKKKG